MAMENHMLKKVESEGLSILQVVAEGVFFCHPPAKNYQKGSQPRLLGGSRKEILKGSLKLPKTSIEQVLC